MNKEKCTRFAQRNMPALQNKTNTPGTLPFHKRNKRKKKKKHAGNTRCKMEHPLSQKLVRAKSKKQKEAKKKKATDEHGYQTNAACCTTLADTFIKLMR